MGNHNCNTFLVVNFYVAIKKIAILHFPSYTVRSIQPLDVSSPFRDYHEQDGRIHPRITHSITRVRAFGWDACVMRVSCVCHRSRRRALKREPMCVSMETARTFPFNRQRFVAPPIPCERCARFLRARARATRKDPFNPCRPLGSRAH